MNLRASLLTLLAGCWLAEAQPIAIIGATVVDGAGAAPAHLDVLVRGE